MLMPFLCTQTHCSLGNYTSDLFKVLSVVGAYEYAGGGQKFCSEHFVRSKVSSLGCIPVKLVTLHSGHGGNP